MQLVPMSLSVAVAAGSSCKGLEVRTKATRCLSATTSLPWDGTRVAIPAPQNVGFYVREGCSFELRGTAQSVHSGREGRPGPGAGALCGLSPDSCARRHCSAVPAVWWGGPAAEGCCYLTGGLGHGERGGGRERDTLTLLAVNGGDCRDAQRTQRTCHATHA